MGDINDVRKIRSSIWGMVLIFAALLLMLVMWIMSDSTSGSQLKSLLLDIKYEVIADDNVKKIYEKNLVPVIDVANDRNEEARKRAILTIHEGFNNFRSGIPGFIEDLNGWGTKFKLISKISQDKWNKWWNENENSHELTQYIHEKFEDHIMTTDQINCLLKDSIVQFSNDLKANRNLMLAEMKVKLTSDNVPVDIRMSESDLESFAVEYDKQFRLKTESYAKDAVLYPVMSLLAGELLESGIKSTSRVVIPILSTFGTWLAEVAASMWASAAASVAGGSSSVLCSLGGGAAGSGGGPVGAVVGLAVGAAIGFVVDLYFEKKFEEKMTIELTGMLDKLELYIIDGHQDKHGLAQIYADINEKMTILYQKASKHALCSL